MAVQRLQRRGNAGTRRSARTRAHSDLLSDVTAKPVWDAIIVGQGLAGTTLAWQLRDAGKTVLIIDACEAVTSSKIAAGLITPITGQRLALSWRVDDMLPVAQRFYADIETRTGKTFFHARPCVRLFASEAESANWAQRSQNPAFQKYASAAQPSPLVAADVADSSGGGFEMQAAQLDVAAYLEASAAHFPYVPSALDWQRDVTFGENSVTILGHKAKLVISCEGFAVTRNPYFSWVPFRSAKGDVLTIRVERMSRAPVPPVALHRGIWVAPTSNPDVFRVGATYDWETLDQVPSVTARLEIEDKLTAFFRRPYTVIDHQAAVRPIMHESKARIGLHPAHPQLGYFNGLGSKGSLHAPWFAKCFAEFIAKGVPILEDLDVGQLWPTEVVGLGWKARVI
jgi:glycine oxidase